MGINQHEELDALMARLADGDRSAFTPVFRTLWTPMLRFCRTLARSDADAADAAQAAMQKILERANDYDRSRPAMPWAFAIAGWECRTLLRKATRRRETPDDAAPEPAHEFTEDEFVERDLVRAALDALGELSPEDRETLLVTFTEEAASVSGATLRKRRQRALDRLRTAFRRLYGID
jgi:RNA polymerase sigma-70 factor (ECF subfamily)